MGNLDIKEQKKKWIYLKEWNCYKLEQVCYCEKPRVQKEQSMNIFVPAEYLDGQGNVLHEEIRMGYTASTAPVIFENGLAGEATRTLFETAHVYKEGLDVYGSKKSFEWGFSDGADPYITELTEPGLTVLNQDMSGFRGRLTPSEQIKVPNYYQDLPPELYHFTVGGNYDATNPQDSLKVGAGAGHHGAHPHLVHEFVSSILEDREPAVGIRLACQITDTCLAIHESAMRHGERIAIPDRN